MTNSLQLEFFESTQPKVVQGCCLDVMKDMQENSIDFIVTDPPYGLHFMGKGWDKFKHYQMESRYVETSRGIEKIRKGQPLNQLAGTYDENRNDEFQEFIRQVGIEMLRILKPGGHVAMFGAPRRHHRQMSGLEDAGFEIRDCIAWITGQGFPKSHNFGRKIGGIWEGFGTALKPSFEPIIIAMKPLDGTFAQNAEKWGVAGINIDDTRIFSNESLKRPTDLNPTLFKGLGSFEGQEQKGRWPANLILDEESAAELDKMTGVSTSKNVPRNNKKIDDFLIGKKPIQTFGHNDSGGPSRFFYVAKASSSERNRGLEGMPLKETHRLGAGLREGKHPELPSKGQNSHPTVKPISLMKYIIKLLAPPGNPILLDPFCGSGSTLVAAKDLGISAIGIEKEQEYCEIAKARIA